MSKTKRSFNPRKVQIYLRPWIDHDTGKPFAYEHKWHKYQVMRDRWLAKIRRGQDGLHLTYRYNMSDRDRRQNYHKTQEGLNDYYDQIEAEIEYFDEQEQADYDLYVQEEYENSLFDYDDEWREVKDDYDEYYDHSWDWDY